MLPKTNDKQKISAKRSPVIKYMSKPEEIKMSNNKKSDADKTNMTLQTQIQLKGIMSNKV